MLTVRHGSPFSWGTSSLVLAQSLPLPSVLPFATLLMCAICMSHELLTIDLVKGVFIFSRALREDTERSARAEDCRVSKNILKYA